MRLISYRTPRAFEGEPGRSERLGVLIDGRVFAARSLDGAAPATMAGLLDGLPDSLKAVRQAVDGGNVSQAGSLALDEVELLPPVPRPGKIVAIGINYHGHAREQEREPPTSPVVFAKFASALVAHGADVTWDPGLTRAVDFEAELAVVIGRPARSVSAAEALDHVLGYTCLNDVSARDLQYADRQFVRAKSLDTFGPMGPALVTADEVGDPQTLAIRCLVNGEVMQESSTSDMVFAVAELIAFCSRSFTLEAGDVIATGTPAGVGWFRDPKRTLRDGDEVIVEIESVGRLVNRCREVAG